METTVLHNPTLESILMVEESIKKSDNDLGKYQLWKRLPKKMMYQTFQVIINYLIDSGKIIIDKKRKLIWVYNPLLVKEVLSRGVKLR